MVDSILGQSKQIQRDLNKVKRLPNEDGNLRLIILTGTSYENEFKKFARQMNSLLNDFKIQIVMSTGPTLARLLFNNSNININANEQCDPNCFVCKNGLQNKSGAVVSTVSGMKYQVPKYLSCGNGGIYVVKGRCNGQYSGKTIHFGIRGKEHFVTNKTSSIYNHKQTCKECNTFKDFDITYVENFTNRGKYSLSEREYFWNNRIKGVINTQKTLKSD